MINSKVSFSLTEIRRGKGKNKIFHYIFFNKDISITFLYIDVKCCMVFLHIPISRDVCLRFFYLGPSLYFM